MKLRINWGFIIASVLIGLGAAYLVCTALDQLANSQ